ncbi:hypothetical protein CPT_Sigurd_062 [Enterococcus phage Sigurd]|nr:hypothetical protein CPT_Sigurd_062 [Enterococcus phage Sigurd]
MKTAWLVKVDYKGATMKGFTSYDRALRYYNIILDNIENQIEERNYEKIVTKTHGNKEIVTQFIYWNEDYTFRTRLGLVSIKQIEWDE